MAVGMLIQFPGMSTETYDQVMRDLDWDDAPKPPGFVSHYACAGPDGLVIFDVWESQEDFENFLHERLGAAIGTATGGNPPAANPVFARLHREEHR